MLPREATGVKPKTKAGVVIGKVAPQKSKPGYNAPSSKAAVTASKQVANPAPSLQAIMAQSGSTDPSDPYNWRGIAAALSAQQSAAPSAPSAPSYSAPSSYTPNVSGAAASPTPAITPTFETPASYVAPAVMEPPKGVTETAQGAAGAPVGQTFDAYGGGLTAGLFERMRNKRTPRTGLSVTPEMLMAEARKRLG